jgi:hypothetical protein
LPPVATLCRVGLSRVGFPYVYAPITPPVHEDFRFEWKNNLDCSRDGHNLRCMFVASRKELHNPKLVSLLDRVAARYTLSRGEHAFFPIRR